MSLKRKARRTCPICNATKFRSTEDGIVCKYGHKMLGVQIEVQEDFGRLGTLERKRFKKGVTEEPKVSSAKIKSDLLLVNQFALQVFSRCMVQDLNFPPELESTVRELWLLYVGNSKTELYEAYIYEANEKKSNEPQAKKEETLFKFEEEEKTLDSILPSESESEDEDPALREAKRVKEKAYRWPEVTYAETLSFIHIACTYLNYPVLLDDLIRWCIVGLIPFLDIQRRVPSEFHYRNRNMSAVPAYQRLADSSCRLFNAFQNRCNLKFPPINISLYLERFCTQFYLPVQGYYYAEYLYKYYTSHRKVRNYLAPSEKAHSAATVALASVLAAAKIIYEINGSDTYLNWASKYNATLSKENWLQKIRGDIERWNDVEKSLDDLKIISKSLRQVSSFARTTASSADKQPMIVGFLERMGTVVREGPSSSTSTPSKHNLFMEPEQLPTNEIGTEIPTHIEEGVAYYRHSGKYMPKDLQDLLSLGILINAENEGRGLEDVLRALDTLLFQRSSRIGYHKFNEAYGLTNGTAREYKKFLIEENE